MGTVIVKIIVNGIFAFGATDSQVHNKRHSDTF